MEFIMTPNEIKTSSLIQTSTSNHQDQEYNIPLCMEDIISICKVFGSLGWQIQNQIDNILDMGIEEAIKNGNVKETSLPHIKYFLNTICDNPYFGDAVAQAQDCLFLIHQYEEKYQVKYISTAN
jgi:hypothetical protein